MQEVETQEVLTPDMEAEKARQELENRYWEGYLDLLAVCGLYDPEKKSINGDAIILHNRVFEMFIRDLLRQTKQNNHV